METNTEKKNIAGKIRHLFQTGAGAFAQPGLGQAILGGGVGAEQSNFLSNLFNPDTTLATFFNTAFKSAIILGAMLAVLRLGYAGFIYMTTDLPGSKGNAREIITETVLGLLLLLAVWLILNQINPNILNLNILQNVTPAQQAQ